MPDKLVPKSDYVWSKRFPPWHDDERMSWTRQLAPAILRYAAPLPSGGRAASSPAAFLGGARCMSRFSPTPSSLGGFDVKDMLGKALDFKGSVPENRSPADMWADKSNNLKLPPPPDAWTGMSVNASIVPCRMFATGRRLAVRHGDLQNAFQQLNQRLRQNHVAKEIALTVRHEKKGDKRARLRSQRWRKRFADAACTPLLPSHSRVLTTHVPVGQEKGATGQYDTSAGWLRSRLLFQTVCYTIPSCSVDSDRSLVTSRYRGPSLPDFPRVRAESHNTD